VLRNNAQEVRRDPASFLASAQPNNVPSHYIFLLISEVMASSPLLEPARDIRRLVLDDNSRDSGFGAYVGGSHFRGQLFLGIYGRTKGRGFTNSFSR
jgi:hypothetical protein